MSVRFNYLLPALVLALMMSVPLPAAAAGIPSIESEITVPGWWVIGPFLSGVREAGTSALAFDRDAVQFETPLLRPEYPSALIPGGDARWRYYETGENGMLSVDYPEVPEESMELVTDEWGFAGAYTVGYAFTTIHIEDGPRRALLDLRHAGGVSINGVPWPGDPYGHGMGLTPVLLDDGDNELKVSVGSRQRFSFKLLPVEDDLIAFPQSATLPDLVRGEKIPVHYGIPLANTTGEWITLCDAGVQTCDWTWVMNMNIAIAPYCIYNLPLTLDLPDEAPVIAPYDLEDKTSFTLKLGYGDKILEVPLTLEVRDPDQARRVTFISDMDLSVQYYGLLPPADFDPAREYGLILSLHGAGVEGGGQARSYQPKDWAFVAAPTNRRRFGFDWQDWGQRDMLEVLADVQANHHIDDNRIHLTGHSMGGHGTWYNGLTFPDKWATIAPSAGWTRFDLYAPMFLRKNLLYGEPKANYIWQLAMRPDDTLALAENTLNLPVYALEGGADDNVPPQQPRLLYEQLTRLGYDVTYEEVPGMGHWWNNPDTPGMDCVDSAAMNEFWESHVRNPWPKQVIFKTANYSINDGAYWVHGVPERAGEDMVIRADADGNVVKIATTNTQGLRINLSAELVEPDQVTLIVDDDEMSLNLADNDGEVEINLLKLNNRWGWSGPQLLERAKGNDPTSYGPFKGVLFQPSWVVADTSGPQDEAALAMQIARLYSYHWWYRANGCLPVNTITNRANAADDSYPFSPRTVGIFIMGPGSEAAIQWLQHRAVISPADGGVNVRGVLVPGTDLTYKFIHPVSHPIKGIETILIEGGTSVEAMKRLTSMMGIYSGAGLPDWMIWEDEVKLRGLGGVAAMGFFDLDWEFDPGLSYFNQDLINRLKP